MHYIVLAIHIFCSLGLIITVLLQAGKGGGLAGTFGAGAVESAFGSGSSDILKKATTTMAIVFMVTSLSLAFMSAKRSSTLMKSLKEIRQEEQTQQKPLAKQPQKQVQKTVKKVPANTSNEVDNKGGSVQKRTDVQVDEKSGLAKMVSEITKVVKVPPKDNAGSSSAAVKEVKSTIDEKENLEDK